MTIPITATPAPAPASLFLPSPPNAANPAVSAPVDLHAREALIRTPIKITSGRQGITRAALLAVLAGLSCGVTIGIASCARTPRQAAPITAAVSPPTMADTAPADLAGLHNVVAYHEGFLSGSVPEGDAGFDTLRSMGIKTIISVDGAEPDLALAHARGLRYIHLPIGYNGFDEQRRLELSRATRDAMNDGPVYIHCHHGKHRSAGAAAAIAATLGWQSPQTGVERMKVSGTAPGYTGLYECALASAVVSTAAIDAAPADFPEVSKPAGFVANMVEVDEVFDHLSDIERAGWQVPTDHPDLVPAAEAGRLVDLFRAAHASDYTTKKPAEFAEMLQKDTARAQKLEDLIAAGTATKDELSAAFKPIGASCKECHTKHRDKAPW